MNEDGVRQEAAKSFPALYPILDAELVLRDYDKGAEERRHKLRQLVRELAEAGVEILQYRNKRDDDGLVLEDARAMRAEAPGLRLILNDRPALVAEARWDGVHVGQEDLAAGRARALVGGAAIVGLSTHNEAQVIAADREPVDYIAIGPVFATATKADTSPVIGIEGVARARALTKKPLVAIGGVTQETARAVCEAGADGVAVIAAIFGVDGERGRSEAQRARDFLVLFK